MGITVLDLDASAYTRNTLHAEDRAWVEKNCYVDIWIEVIHAVGCDPIAMLPFVVALDFEGDQWTFYKPKHEQLRTLYGIDVQELNCWRPLIEHAVEHLGAGKLISTEADAWWLPDTSGTDYRRQHTKSTIVLNELDVENRRLGYWHNAGYFTLEGEDFARTFRLDIDPEAGSESQPLHVRPDPAFMPFYAELVRIDRLIKREPADLAARSGELLALHLSERPLTNPVERFAKRFADELPRLQDKGLAHYHAWAFATVRQLGSAAELASIYLRWLAAGGRLDAAGTSGGQFAPAIEAYDKISSGAKSFILKAARAVNGKKAFDGTAIFDDWAKAWETAITTLVAKPD